MMTYDELMEKVAAGMVKRDHTSLTRGYISRKLNDWQCPIEEYRGKFGKGWTIKTPNFKSNLYCYITYYLEVTE